MVRTILAVMFCLVFTCGVEAQSLNLIPLPAKVQMGGGQLVIGPTFSVSIAGRHEPRLDSAMPRSALILAVPSAPLHPSAVQ